MTAFSCGANVFVRYDHMGNIGPLSSHENMGINSGVGVGGGDISHPVVFGKGGTVNSLIPSGTTSRKLPYPSVGKSKIKDKTDRVMIISFIYQA